MCPETVLNVLVLDVKEVKIKQLNLIRKAAKQMKTRLRLKETHLQCSSNPALVLLTIEALLRFAGWFLSEIV